MLCVLYWLCVLPLLHSTDSSEDDVGGGYASEPNTNTEFFNKVNVPSYTNTNKAI